MDNQSTKYKILALFGPAGAGKNYIQDVLLDSSDMFYRVVSTTTRPPRASEKDGREYHFVTPKDFGKKVLNFSMLEATCFNDWFYGTAIEDLDIFYINIGVFSIHAIDCLLQDNRLEILPVYIKSDDKIRLQRQLDREEKPDCKEICRRFLADDKDFSDIPFEYHLFINNCADRKTILNQFNYILDLNNWTK